MADIREITLRVKIDVDEAAIASAMAAGTRTVEQQASAWSNLEAKAQSAAGQVLAAGAATYAQGGRISQAVTEWDRLAGRYDAVTRAANTVTGAQRALEQVELSLAQRRADATASTAERNRVETQSIAVLSSVNAKIAETTANYVRLSVAAKEAAASAAGGAPQSPESVQKGLTPGTSGYTEVASLIATLKAQQKEMNLLLKEGKVDADAALVAFKLLYAEASAGALKVAAAVREAEVASKAWLDGMHDRFGGTNAALGQLATSLTQIKILTREGTLGQAEANDQIFVAIGRYNELAAKAQAAALAAKTAAEAQKLNALGLAAPGDDSGHAAREADLNAAFASADAAVSRYAPARAAAQQLGDEIARINELGAAGVLWPQEVNAALYKLYTDANAGAAQLVANTEALNAAYAGWLNTLDSKYRPAIVAAREYAATQVEVRAMVDAGRLSQMQASDALVVAAQRYADLRTEALATGASLREAAENAKLAALGFTPPPTAAQTSNRGEDIEAYAAALDKERYAFDRVFAVSKDYEAEFNRLNAALAGGAIAPQVFNQRLDELNLGFRKAQSEVKNHRDTIDSLTKSNAQSQFAMRQLGVQAIQTFSGFATGQPIMMTLIQQGHQVFDVMLAAGVSFEKLTMALKGWAVAVWPAVAGFAAFAAPLAIIGAIVIALELSNRRLIDMQQLLRATRTDWEEVGKSAFEAAKTLANNSVLTSKQARETVTTFQNEPLFNPTDSSGGIEDTRVKLGQLSADISRVFGVDLPAATAKLTAAMRDPAAAAQDLATKHFPGMTAAISRQVEVLVLQGHTLEATNIVIDAYTRQTKGAADATTNLGRIWENLGRIFSKTLDLMLNAVNALLDAIMAAAKLIPDFGLFTGKGGTSAGGPNPIMNNQGSGATGLFQVMPETARRYPTLDAMTEAGNVEIGILDFKEKLKTYNGDLDRTLQAFGGYVSDEAIKGLKKGVPSLVDYLASIRSQDVSKLPSITANRIEGFAAKYGVDPELYTILKQLVLKESGGYQTRQNPTPEQAKFDADQRAQHWPAGKLPVVPGLPTDADVASANAAVAGARPAPLTPAEAAADARAEEAKLKITKEYNATLEGQRTLLELAIVGAKARRDAQVAGSDAEKMATAVVAEMTGKLSEMRTPQAQVTKGFRDTADVQGYAEGAARALAVADHAAEEAAHKMGLAHADASVIQDNHRIILDGLRKELTQNIAVQDRETNTVLGLIPILGQTQKATDDYTATKKAEVQALKFGAEGTANYKEALALLTAANIRSADSEREKALASKFYTDTIPGQRAALQSAIDTMTAEQAKVGQGSVRYGQLAEQINVVRGQLLNTLTPSQQLNRQLDQATTIAAAASGAAKELAQGYQQANEAARASGREVASVTELEDVRTRVLARLAAQVQVTTDAQARDTNALAGFIPLLGQTQKVQDDYLARQKAINQAREAGLPGSAEEARFVEILTAANIKEADTIRNKAIAESFYSDTVEGQRIKLRNAITVLEDKRKASAGDAEQTAQLSIQIGMLNGQLYNTRTASEQLLKTQQDRLRVSGFEAGAAKTLADLYLQADEAAKSHGEKGASDAEKARLRALTLQGLAADLAKELELNALQIVQNEKTADTASKGARAIDDLAAAHKGETDAVKEGERGSQAWIKSAALRTQANKDVAQSTRDIAAAQSVAGSAKQIEAMQVELSLVGSSVEVRNRELAILKERQTRGLQIGQEASAWEQKAINAAAASANLQTMLQRQTESAAYLANAFSSAFQTIADAITQAFVQGQGAAVNWGNVVKAVMSQVVKALLELSLINPLKNWISGSNAPSLTSVLSTLGGGLASQPSQQTTATGVTNIFLGNTAAASQGFGPGQTDFGFNADTNRSTAANLISGVSGGFDFGSFQRLAAGVGGIAAASQLAGGQQQQNVGGGGLLSMLSNAQTFGSAANTFSGGWLGDALGLTGPGGIGSKLSSLFGGEGGGSSIFGNLFGQGGFLGSGGTVAGILNTPVFGPSIASSVYGPVTAGTAEAGAGLPIAAGAGTIGQFAGGIGGGFALGSAAGGLIQGALGKTGPAPTIGAGVGAVGGALAGTLLFPGVGTVIGGLIGGLLGGSGGGLIGPKVASPFSSIALGIGGTGQLTQGATISQKVDTKALDDNTTSNVKWLNAALAANNTKLTSLGPVGSLGTNTPGGFQAPWKFANFDEAFPQFRFGSTTDKGIDAAVKDRSFKGVEELSAVFTAVNKFSADLASTDAADRIESFIQSLAGVANTDIPARLEAISTFVVTTVPNLLKGGLGSYANALKDNADSFAAAIAQAHELGYKEDELTQARNEAATAITNAVYAQEVAVSNSLSSRFNAAYASLNPDDTQFAKASALYNFDVSAQQQRVARTNELKGIYGQAYTLSNEYADKMAELERTLGEERLAIIKQADTAILAAEKQAMASAAAFISQLNQYVLSLQSGADSPLSPALKLSTSQQVFNETNAKAQAGDATAMTELSGTASTLLAAAKSYFGGATAGYVNIFSQVVQAIKGIANKTPEDLTKSFLAAQNKTADQVLSTELGKLRQNVTTLEKATVATQMATTDAVKDAAIGAALTPAEEVAMLSAHADAIYIQDAVNTAAAQNNSWLSTIWHEIVLNSQYLGAYGEMDRVFYNSFNELLLGILNKPLAITWPANNNTAASTASNDNSFWNQQTGNSNESGGGAVLGGWIGNGVWNRDSVRAAYAGGGDIMLAGGEFVMSAPAAARYADILPAMNSGRVRQDNTAPDPSSRLVVRAIQDIAVGTNRAIMEVARALPDKTVAARSAEAQQKLARAADLPARPDNGPIIRAVQDNAAQVVRAIPPLRQDNALALRATHDNTAQVTRALPASTAPVVRALQGQLTTRAATTQPVPGQPLQAAARAISLSPVVEELRTQGTNICMTFATELRLQTVSMVDELRALRAEVALLRAAANRNNQRPGRLAG